MNDDQKKKFIKTMKKVSRQAQLERERLVGRPRAHTYGGKPNARENRLLVKRELRNLDCGNGEG